MFINIFNVQMIYVNTLTGDFDGFDVFDFGFNENNG